MDFFQQDQVDFANSNLSFPQKLFALLEYENDDLIQWAPNGLCFRLVDQDRFANEVVPKYFKQTKLTSFQRQLNLYGFRRLAKGEDQGCYFHPRFQRGRRDLLDEIKRLPVKGSLPTYDQLVNSTRLGPYQYDPSGSHKRSADEISSSLQGNDVPQRKMTTRLSSQQQQLQKELENNQQANHNNNENLNAELSSDKRFSLSQFSGGRQSGFVSSQHSTGGPQRMSKLTMNFGYGKNTATLQSDLGRGNTSSSNSRNNNSPTHSMDLRNNNRPLYRQLNHSSSSPSTSNNNPYSNSNFYYQLPYSFPASALPISSNFASEGGGRHLHSSFNKNFGDDNNAASDLVSNLRSQPEQESTKDSSLLPSLSQGLFEGSDRIPPMLGDDFDVLDLFSGDIPQSTHGTPIPSTPLTESLVALDSTLLSANPDELLAGEAAAGST